MCRPKVQTWWPAGSAPSSSASPGRRRPRRTRPLAGPSGSPPASPPADRSESLPQEAPVADVLAAHAVVEGLDQRVLLGSHLRVGDLATTEPLVHLHQRGVEVLRGQVQLLLRALPP